MSLDDPHKPEPASEPAMDWLRALWRRRRLIALVAVGLTAADLGAGLLMERTYRAEALLQIDDRINKLVDMQAFAAPVLSDGGVIKSQVDIIRSPHLALQVIRSQRLMETEEFREAVTPIHREALAFIAGLLPERTIRRLPDRIQAIARRPWVADTLRAQRRQEEDAIRYFQKRMDVDANMQGRTIRIRFQSESPELAAAVTNAMAAAYVDDQIDYKLESVRRTNVWLAEQIERLRQKAKESEDRLAEFRRQNQLGTERAPAFTQQQLSELNTALITASAQHAQAAAKLREAEAATRNGGVEGTPDVLASPAIHDLRRQETEVSRELAELRSVYGETNSGIVRNRAQLQEIRTRLQQEVRRILGSLRADAEVAEARRAEIERRITEFRVQTDSKEPVNVQAAILAREAAVNRSVFAAVVKRAEETNAVDGLQRPDTRIVAGARIPGRHYAPKLELIGLVGAILSLTIAIAIAALLEYLNTTIRAVGQGERVLGINGAGWLPLVRQPLGRLHDLPLDLPYSPYAESLRSIAVTLKAFFKRHRTVLLVTSATPCEGKTSFALSYARSLAYAGQKCLVIDCDLRRPIVNMMLNGRTSLGLSDVVARRASLDQVLQVDQCSNLVFIGAGEAGEDPLAILDSAVLGKVIAAARERFDTIIIDAPPLLAVSDAVMLAQYADLTMMVVAWDRTPARAVTDSIKQLRQAGATSVSFVLSQVDISCLGSSDMETYSVGYGPRNYPRNYNVRGGV